MLRSCEMHGDVIVAYDNFNLDGCPYCKILEDKENISEYENQIENLETEKENLENKIYDLEEKCEVLTYKNKNLDENYLESNDKIDTLEAKIKELQTENTLLRIDLKNISLKLND